MTKSALSRRNGATGFLDIHAAIGDGDVSAKLVNERLRATGDVKTLHVSICSSGGDVSQGFAIFNMLKRHAARKIVTIDGLAASMASVIAMAGDEIRIPENSFVMIHNPSGITMGQSDEIISFGEAIGKMRDAIVQTYAARTGQEATKIQDMMDAETWLDAEEAVALGFADKMTAPIEAMASLDLSKFQNVPRALRPKPRTWDDVRARAFAKFNSPAPRVVDESDAPPARASRRAPSPADFEALSANAFKKFNNPARKEADYDAD